MLHYLGKRILEVVEKLIVYCYFENNYVLHAKIFRKAIKHQKVCSSVVLTTIVSDATVGNSHFRKPLQVVK